MKLITESDYRAKVLFLSFESPCVIEDKAGIRKLQSQWFEALKSWHSPYKALFDGSNLCIKQKDGEVLDDEFSRLKKLLERFFLRKAAVFGLNKEAKELGFPFPVFDTKEEAVKDLGIRDLLERKFDKNSLRSLISFDNHFKDGVVELSFMSAAHFKEKKDLLVLKSKLMNNLVLWHSSWNLLVDCSKLEIDETLHEEFFRVQKFFSGFFLKQIIGYHSSLPKDKYPFPVFRSRHKAVLQMEEAGRSEGDVANCSTRK